MTEAKKTNRLQNAHSPYLRSAAHQPVDWHEWGPEAFDKARRPPQQLDAELHRDLHGPSCGVREPDQRLQIESRQELRAQSEIPRRTLPAAPGRLG